MIDVRGTRGKKVGLAAMVKPDPIVKSAEIKNGAIIRADDGVNYRVTNYHPATAPNSGTLVRVAPVIKGKAAVKRMKRERQAARRREQHGKENTPDRLRESGGAAAQRETDLGRQPG